MTHLIECKIASKEVELIAAGNGLTKADIEQHLNEIPETFIQYFDPVTHLFACVDGRTKRGTFFPNEIL